MASLKHSLLLYDSKKKAISVSLVFIIMDFASISIILSLTLAVFLLDKMRLKTRVGIGDGVRASTDHFVL